MCSEVKMHNDPELIDKIKLFVTIFFIVAILKVLLTIVYQFTQTDTYSEILKAF